MKKNILFLMLFTSFFISNSLFAQNKEEKRIDSLLARLQISKDDSIKERLYIDIINLYIDFNPKEGLKYVHPSLQLAEKLNWKSGNADLKYAIGRIYWRLGRFEEALKYHNEVLKIREESGDKKPIANAISNIGQDYADNGKYPEAIEQFSMALKIFEEIKEKKSMADIYNLLAWVYGNQGNLGESTKMTYESLKIYEDLGEKYSAAIAMANIAEDYTELGNYTEALRNYVRSIKPLEEEGDKINLSNSYSGIGDVYKLMGNYTEALKNQVIALNIAKEIKNTFAIASASVNIGKLLDFQGKYAEALEYYLPAVKLYKEISNKQELAEVYNKIGICYTHLNKYTDAKKYFDNALALSKELDTKVVITDYYGGVQLLDSFTGNWKSAYINYRKYIIGRDSIYSQESTKKIVQTQMQYDSDKKEAIEKAEQDKKDIRQRTIRNSIASGLAGALIFLVVVYRQRNKISKARKRSDELLLNILPAETAEELKATGSAKAKDYIDVTVMFTDFKNFTSMSEKLSAQELVNEINYCYSAFDHIITKYGIEKIKTIGDSYMCAAGLPIEKPTHALDAVQAALEISNFVEVEKKKRLEKGLPYFEIRIGLNSGPVVAGIVGIKKFAYDIWGDTVNIASRMESSGETGKVNISGSTYKLVKDNFICTHRGKIEAKNKGEIDMYFVNLR